MVKLVETVSDVPEGWWFTLDSIEGTFYMNADNMINPGLFGKVSVRYGLCTSNEDELKYLMRKGIGNA